MSVVTPPRELVLASAGSGKTYRIASALAGLLGYGAEPDHVLAATFTRKAAGQILDRVLVRLARAAIDASHAATLAGDATFDGAQPLSPDPEVWAGVLERTVRRLHRVNVGTLDAFFMRAATAFGTELGLPPSWRVANDPAAARLRSRALLQVLDSVDRQRLIDLLRLVSRGTARRSVHDHLVGMIDQLLEFHEQLDPDVERPWGVFGDADGGIPPTESERMELAASLAAVPLPRSANGSENTPWRKSVDEIHTLLVAGDWESLVSRGLCQRIASGAQVFNRFAISPAMRACLEEVLHAARRALRPKLAGQIEALGELTRNYESSFRALQRQAGLLGFRDITRVIGAGDPLGDRADFYYRLDSRTQHLLLDEFQDTSHTQLEALRPVLDEVLGDEGRVGVIVADPKQSIYGWRGAEPEVVHSVGAHYQLVHVPLSLSYRSSQVILDLVNTVFGRIATLPIVRDDEVRESTASLWARDFRPHQAKRRELPGYVQVEAGPADEGRSSVRPLLTAFVAERVKEVHDAAPGFTIGVLTRTNAAVARLFHRLGALGLSVSQEGGNPLSDSAACEAVLALLRMADHPADRISRYHVAVSPLGPMVGFVDHRDDAGAHRVANDLRRRLLLDGYGQTLNELARRIAPSCDRREARRLAQLAELAHRFDADATLRPADFVRLAEAERVEDRTLADVRVMTIHQAKGLEFDIVVLPQLDEPIFRGGRPPPALAYRRDPAGRISGIFPFANKELRCLFSELEVPHAQSQAAILRDGLSGLYVGLTRARYAVHAILAPDGEKGPSSTFTPARILREALAAPGESLTPAVTGATLYESGNPDWFRHPLAEPENPEGPREPAPPLRLMARLEQRSALRRQTPSSLHGTGRVDVREFLRIDTRDSLRRGSIVHAWFERVGWIEEGEPDDHLVLELGRSTAPEARNEEVRATLADFRRWLTVAEVRQALSRGRYPANTVELERELSFMHRSGDVLMEGAIDRLVVSYENDTPVAAEVIDFKTDRTGTDAARVASLKAHYSGQLAAYAAAVEAMYRLPAGACRATLIFLEAGRVESVSVAAVPQATSGDDPAQVSLVF